MTTSNEVKDKVLKVLKHITTGVVRFDKSQSLNQSQKNQVCSNIGAASKEDITNNIPRQGSRGKLAGHEAMNAALTGAQTINKQSLA